jgi:hypothetical protein
LIGAETGIKTIAAAHSQCLLWVKSGLYSITSLARSNIACEN